MGQLRESLHDPVKQSLGLAKYRSHFLGASFARRGGLPGTTSRLQGWFTALTACLNSGVCSPSDTAFVLQFLDTPLPSNEPSPVEADLGSRPHESWMRTAPRLRPQTVPSTTSSAHDGRRLFEDTPLPSNGPFLVEAALGSRPPVYCKELRSKADQAAVERLMGLGFSAKRSLEAYLACDQKEELAATLLFESSGD